MAIEYNFHVRFPQSWSLKQIQDCDGLALLREWKLKFMWDVNDKRVIHAELTDEQAMALKLNDLEVKPDPPTTGAVRHSK